MSNKKLSTRNFSVKQAELLKKLKQDMRLNDTFPEQTIENRAKKIYRLSKTHSISRLSSYVIIEEGQDIDDFVYRYLFSIFHVQVKRVGGVWDGEYVCWRIKDLKVVKHDHPGVYSYKCTLKRYSYEYAF